MFFPFTKTSPTIVFHCTDFHRPSAAGAVLNTFIINSLIKSLILCENIFNKSSLGNRSLGAKTLFERRFTSPPPVTCHVSHVLCHLSHVTCHMSHLMRERRQIQALKAPTLCANNLFISLLLFGWGLWGRKKSRLGTQFTEYMQFVFTKSIDKGMDITDLVEIVILRYAHWPA